MATRASTARGSALALGTYLSRRRKALGLSPAQAASRSNGRISRIEVLLVERGAFEHPPVEILQGFARA